MSTELRVLQLEDVPTDAELVLRELRKAGITFTALRTDQREAFIRALTEFRPEVILADYKLPGFDGLSALHIAREQCPDVPFLFVTGTLGEETATEMLRQGATDYILKDRLVRLGPAVQRAVEEAAERIRHRQADEALHESEERFRLISASAQDAIVIMDPEGEVTYWNPAAEKMFGYGAGEALGKDMHRLIVPARHYDAYSRGMVHFRATGEGPVIGTTQEVFALRKGGEEFPVELSMSAVKIKGQWHALGIMRDITERKRAETALHKVNRALKTLSNCNEALVHATTEHKLLQDICRILVDTGEYRMAWVGFAAHDEHKTVRPVARFGAETSYLDDVSFTWTDTELGRGPTGTAIRTGTTQITQDILTDPRMEPWRKEATKHGFASSIALPLRDEAGSFGALTMYSHETDAFNAEEVRLLQELAADLAFGIVSLRTREEHQTALEQLGRSMESTIQAVAATVEMRDPYTAGHQRRVAQLAAAIALELGLDEKQIHSIHLAGIVHDLGKINIPAEILSRPGRLNEIEYKLIQVHPQAGYEILKDVEFPWPIAQMVLQHHERLNGSGYPQGLKGDDILPEAKILSVADVVEAMTSHRPYRPGLGLDAALEEIARDRGTLYDSAAVDACLRLFKEKKFEFQA